MSAIDAFFFAVSSSTESGLNTVDVKDLKLAQQLVIYFFPIITNLATVNIITVVIRIWYFEKRFREIGGFAPRLLRRCWVLCLLLPLGPRVLKERRTPKKRFEDSQKDLEVQGESNTNPSSSEKPLPSTASPQVEAKTPEVSVAEDSERQGHIAWAESVGPGKALRIPSPSAREQGHSQPINITMVAQN